jgi:hypothetical protein
LGQLFGASGRALSRGALATDGGAARSTR